MAGDDHNTTEIEGSSSAGTAAGARAALQPGQVIDGFRLEERTHQGGMAQLWRVTKIGSDDPMPLIMKVPRIKGGDDPTTIVGFEVERMILPIEGDSLKPRFDAAPIPLDEVAHIGAKVATALHDLHRQNVIHLDVKPSNIMFRPEKPDGSGGEAVLVDFGLSRHDHLPDLLEEEFELPIGTGPYMSPEQVQFVRSDPRSDLFALGVMLYHLATGQRPFGSPDTVRGLRQRLYREPVPPRALRPDCPPWLQEIILRCLEVDPDKRHQSAAQLAFELQHPEQVALTERAARAARRGGALQRMKRWFSAVGAEPAATASAVTQTAKAPIVMAAVDVSGDPALLAEMHRTVQRLLRTEPAARLACVSVMKINRIGIDELTEADGSSRHVNLLVQLKHWARALMPGDAAVPGAAAAEVQDGRVTFHVLEAADPAAAIVEFGRKNQVDHIVMGARSSGALRRYLGSVSAQVAAQAPCTVTVVRAPETADAA